MTRPDPSRKRCAIYTRKSSEEGLEQEFNSLQAQREACEAFTASQRHEGWVCLRAGYDDGGFSGATIERPALRRLLADIDADQVAISGGDADEGGCDRACGASTRHNSATKLCGTQRDSRLGDELWLF